MKFTKIALACGLAFAAMSAQAANVPNASTVPESNIVYMSGATAPDGFLAGVAAQMFQPGFITVRGLTETDNFLAYVGTSANAATGFPVGTPVIFIKRSLGGSVWGVSPVATGDNIQTMDVKSANCTAPGTVSGQTTWRCPIIGTDPQGNVNGSGGRVPDMGISDIEPAMFKAPYNTENNAPQLTNAQIAALVSLPTNQIMMGIVATNAVSAAPHIGRSQYGAALAGKLTSWNQIDGSTSPMVVCRRVNGSGTQTSYNWFFSGFPCNASTLGSASTPPVGVDASAGLNVDDFLGTVASPFEITPAGLTIVENSTSGDVRNCLSSAYFGLDHVVQGNSGTYYKVLFSTVPGTPVAATINPISTPTITTPPFTATRGGPSKAIGTLSVDSASRANNNFIYAPRNANDETPFSWTFIDNTANKLSNAGWSFRMLDGAGVYNAAAQTASVGATGIAPSKDNMVNGRYDFVVELTMNRRANLAANKVSFFTELRRLLGTPANNVNNAFAALPDLYSYTAPVINTTSVSKYSREGNTCAPLIRFPSL